MRRCLAKLKMLSLKSRPISRSQSKVINSSSSVMDCAAISPVGATIAEPPIKPKPSSLPALEHAPMNRLGVINVRVRCVEAKHDHVYALQPHDTIGFRPSTVVADTHSNDP